MVHQFPGPDDDQDLHWHVHDAWRLIDDAKGYRLPTEAEWEYACRSGTTTQFGHGDEESLLPAYAVYLQSTKGSTQPCGGKLPNAWGLFDMHGNVWEWCQDWYGDYGTDGRVKDPLGAAKGTFRMIRGGCWSSPAGDCGSDDRFWDDTASRRNYLGFRVAR